MSGRCAKHFAWGLQSRWVLSSVEEFICVNEEAVITALKVLFLKKAARDIMHKPTYLCSMKIFMCFAPA